MIKFNIVELFRSIDGEGPTQGYIASFIRFFDCNLRCSFCDTTYSYGKNPYTVKSIDEILRFLEEEGAKNVTLTGGEPLIQKDLDILLSKICDKYNVRIETNGSIKISSFRALSDNLSFVVDYKLNSSNENSKMEKQNLLDVNFNDVYKFVIGSDADFEKALSIINEYDLTKRTNVHFSVSYGIYEPKKLVEKMLEHRLNDVKLSLQIHKFIWDKDKRGV